MTTGAPLPGIFCLVVTLPNYRKLTNGLPLSRLVPRFPLPNNECYGATLNGLPPVLQRIPAV